MISVSSPSLSLPTSPCTDQSDIFSCKNLATLKTSWSDSVPDPEPVFNGPGGSDSEVCVCVHACARARVCVCVCVRMHACYCVLKRYIMFVVVLCVVVLM